MIIGLVVAIALAGAAAGLAWGYRGARDSEREHNQYLRQQLAFYMEGKPLPPSRSLTVREGGRS